MKKAIYFLRHDSAGLLFDLGAFAEPPSAEARESLRADLAKTHGEMHPRFIDHPRHKGERYEVRVVPSFVEVPDGAELGVYVPPVPVTLPSPSTKPGEQPAGHAAPSVDLIQQAATGRVINPGEPTT